MELYNHQFPTLERIKHILCSCYNKKFKVIIFGTQIKEEYFKKNLNHLLVFDAHSVKIIGKSIHQYLFIYQIKLKLKMKIG